MDTAFTVIGIGSIVLVMAAVHPALGIFVLVAGLMLAWLLERSSQGNR